MPEFGPVDVPALRLRGALQKLESPDWGIFRAQRDQSVAQSRTNASEGAALYDVATGPAVRSGACRA
jgi:hypothetical protein